MDQLSDFDATGKKILIITAHPDDADFFAGGTLLKWLNSGAKAAIVIATNGDKGSHDPSLKSPQLARLREKEQLAASNLLGLDNTWFLDFPDAHLENTQELKNKLVKIIREYKPDIVITWDPTVVYSTEANSINHPDHRAVGQAALDCVYPLARDTLTFPQHSGSHCVENLFMFNSASPNFSVDISEFFDKKLELLGKHASQVDSGKLTEEMKSWNSKIGKKLNVSYAEEFTHLHFDKD